LREHGYEHYELASFCRAGFASKHNSGYWDLGSCVAVGSGAHGFIAPQTKSSPGIRYGHAKDIRQYLAAWDKPAVDAERNVFDLILELGLVRLRTQKGIALSDIQKYLPADKAERFWGRIGGNQILGPQVEGEVLRLPEQQWLLENAYLRAFDQCLQEIR
jgi:oxygen-independent coproporphyrinogen-3 oxidase